MKTLSLIVSPYSSIQHNLALEECLLNEKSETDYLLFYINDPCVVIGKHQNPWKELNVKHANSSTVPIARRLTGGGTVYHDLGNINFSFVRNVSSNSIDFREHIAPISAALSSLGVENHITERNDLFMGDFKISGNAEHIHHKPHKVLHHGTLLYDAQLSNLSLLLQASENTIHTHAVDSVRSKVANITTAKDLGSTSDFLKALIDELQEIINPKGIAPLQQWESQIDELVVNKFATWDWSFGHSPRFTWTNNLDEVIEYRRGKIETIQSNLLDQKEIDILLGVNYECEAFKSMLERNNLPADWASRFSIDCI